MSAPVIAVSEELRVRLLPAVRRARSLRLWRAWALIGVGGAAAAIALRALEERTGWGGPWAWAALALLVAGSLVAAFLHLRRRFDEREVARAIERANPELGGLLLAAVSQPRQAGAPLGYLQERVIEDAIDRAIGAEWQSSVPRWRIVLNAVATGAAVSLFAGVLVPEIWPGLPSLFPDAHGLTVAPGDTDAERGTSVLVTARFAKALPPGATLVLRRAGRPTERIPMTRSLEDPVFGAMTPPLTEARIDYQIEFAGGESRRFRVKVFDLPDVERIDARIAYPQQPTAPATELQDVRQLSVARGAAVTLTVRLLRPAATVRLKAEGTATVELRAEDRRRRVFVGTVTPDATRAYDVEVRDEAGRPGRHPPRVAIDVADDAPPRIAVTFPGRDARVSPLEEVTVEARVSDDVGVGAFGVGYRLGGVTKEVTLGRGAAGARDAVARHVIALEALGAKPDDLLAYHFWAEDVTDKGKTRRVRSDMYFAEVRPFEERFREGASGGEGGGQQQQQGGGDRAEDLARAQKDVLNATWTVEREATAGTDVSTDVAVVQKAQADVRKQAEEGIAEARDEGARAALDEAAAAMKRAEEALPRSLAEAIAAEQDAYARLLRLRAREHSVSRGRGGGGEAGGGRSSEGLQALELKSEESRYETRSEASAEPSSPAARDRQLSGRLKDLARRQKALTEKIQELQLALQAAREEEKPELQRRLLRLRDEQREMLDEVDGLAQRVDQQGERSAESARAREALREARARGQEAAEALARGESGRAVGASARAGRELEQLQQEVQKRSARAFTEEAQRLRDRARALADEQAKIGEALARQGAPDAGAGGSPTEARRIGQAMQRQKQAVGGLLDELQKVTDRAEASEPLLSRKLYDTLRRAKNQNVERALDVGGQLAERNLLPQAREAEARAREGIAGLADGVNEAAKSVLGDEAEALRKARGELDTLVEELRREAAGQAAQGQSGQEQGGRAQGQGQARGQGQEQARGQGQQGQGPEGQRGQAQGGQAQAQGGRGQGEGGQRPGGARREGVASAGEGSGPNGNEGPFTGEGFRRWAERLRDVEDALGSERLRMQAARARDRARALRADARRHARPPQWDLVEKEILAPLAELRAEVAEELRRLEPDAKTVPIDRDPVPPRFDEAVRKYYESLATGK